MSESDINTGALQLAKDAREDLDCLSDVFGWLNELFLAVDTIASNEQMLPTARLRKIALLCSLGGNVAVGWQATAENMTGRLEGEVKNLEK